MKSKRFLSVGTMLSLLALGVVAGPGCIEIQSQSTKFVQLTTNIKRENIGITVALNCCPNNQCCSPGVFESGFVLQNNGKCLKQSLLTRGKQALSCTDNETPGLPSHQRRATINGVKNGFSLRCLYANENDDTFDESVTVQIKVLPQLISFNQQVVNQPERGLLLTCKAALGSYTTDSIELSFANYTGSEPSGPIGTTKFDERITRELSGKEKDIADYLRNELNLSAPYEVELKHFIPDRVVFWRNLTIGCQLKLSLKEDRLDRGEFDNLDTGKKLLQINEHNLETLPKVDVTYDAITKRLKCQAFAYPKASSVVWTYAAGRGQNFTEIPAINISIVENPSTDWYVSWYNGPFDPKSVYRCAVQNTIGITTGELEETTTSPVTVSTTTAVNTLVSEKDQHNLWQGPPDPISSQFQFYWVIVVVGILIIFAVAIAVILHLRKRAGAEYKSSKRGAECGDDEEQQRLQDNAKSCAPDAAGSSNEMTDAGAVKTSGHDGSNSKSTDVV